ncbi:hypothetical protein DFH09DRAFT_471241 [Mycena vulgaris]|nr:hypothetical protein DFH09DRAFT_471241 [Mycena vulgaris]
MRMEPDMPPAPSEKAVSPITVQPPSPAWGDAASLSPESPAPAALAREPSPPPVIAPAPPPVAKVSFKEWQARRKLERAKEEEVAQERERERQREQERERERQREREKGAAQGEDKENEVVPVKAEDGLSRILDGIRRSAVSDKPPPVELPVQQDVEMADAPPLVVAPAAAPAPALDDLSKIKVSPPSMTAFVATGNELAVSSVVESRTPSPRLTNGIKREASPLAAGGLASPTVPSPKSPLPDVSPPPPLQSVLHSPEAARYPSPPFTSNGVQRPAPPFAKPFHVPYQTSAPTLTSQRPTHGMSKGGSVGPAISPPLRSQSLSPTYAAK